MKYRCWCVKSSIGWIELILKKESPISAVRFLPIYIKSWTGVDHGTIKSYRVSIKSNNKSIDICSGELPDTTEPEWVLCEVSNSIETTAVRINIDSIYGNVFGINEIEIYGPK